MDAAGAALETNIHSSLLIASSGTTIIVTYLIAYRIYSASRWNGVSSMSRFKHTVEIDIESAAGLLPFDSCECHHHLHIIRPNYWHFRVYRSTIHPGCVNHRWGMLCVSNNFMTLINYLGSGSNCTRCENSGDKHRQHSCFHNNTHHRYQISKPAHAFSTTRG